MKIAFQMEAMTESDPKATNSLLLMQEACKRGYQVFHYLPQSLSIDDQTISAHIAPVTVDLSREDYYTLGDYTAADLTTMDIVFMRQHPPVDMGYITQTYILDHLKRRGVYVTNDPAGIRNTPEKLSIFEFPDFIPPTLVSRDEARIGAFFETHGGGGVIVKPLDLYMGKGIIKTHDVKEALRASRDADTPLMFQKFLPEIKDGNKRVIIFDGQVVAAFKTIPPDDEFLVYRNSRDEMYTLTPEELETCNAAGKTLKDKNIDFAGLDFIGSYLTEINTTCVGSLLRLRDLDPALGLEGRLWDLIERRYKNLKAR